MYLDRYCGSGRWVWLGKFLCPGVPSVFAGEDLQFHDYDGRARKSIVESRSELHFVIECAAKGKRQTGMNKPPTQLQKPPIRLFLLSCNI